MEDGGRPRQRPGSLSLSLPPPPFAAFARDVLSTSAPLSAWPDSRCHGQAYGADPVIESVLVKFTSGSNEAWGEACTLGAPTYSPEHAAGIYCVLKEHFVDLVVGKEFETSEELQDALKWFKGNQFAKVRPVRFTLSPVPALAAAQWC